jgi:L-lactate dehydrogenase (cytochrome)/(S)-mandelate dehydrogenase
MASLIERAAGAGYGAMMVTVDVPVPSNRELEQRQGMGVPPVLTPGRLLDGARRPRWWYAFLKHQRVSLRNLGGEYGVRFGVRGAQRQLGLWRPDLDWDDLAWLRERWDGPMLVKGVLDPEDAVRCLEIGAAGVVVSNHGGRQLDGAPASLDALPPIAAAVGGRGAVILDGGIRRGSDVIKALCLGADAVMIGRPFVYGLAARGERGVAEVLAILTAEIERNLVLMGCPGVAALDRSWVVRRDVEQAL